MADRRDIIIAALVCMVLAGTAFVLLSPVEPPTEDSGGVETTGTFYVPFSYSDITTGTVMLFNQTTGEYKSTVSVGSDGWSRDVQPGQYLGFYEDSNDNYYPRTFTFEVPEGIEGTKTHEVDPVSVYPYSTDYTLTFQKTGTIIATKEDDSQSDSDFSTDTNENTYTLTLQNEDDYSSFGLPTTVDPPHRDAVGNWIMLKFNTTDVACPSADHSITSGSEKKFFIEVEGVTIGSSTDANSYSLALEFLSTGGYSLDIYHYQFTNWSEIEKYETGTAPDGWALNSTQIASTVGVTVS